MENAFLDEVKTKSNLLEVAEELGFIARRSREDQYRGNCPSGHTSVSGTCFNMSSSLYHCFSCQRSGNVIQFVQEYKFGGGQKSFREAVKFLAERVGMQTPDGFNAVSLFMQREDEVAMQVLEVACAYFVHHLTAENRQHLMTRYGFKEKTIEEFGIGFSKPGLFGHLKTNFSPQEILSSGLFIQFPNKIAELFVNRLTFPYLSGKKPRYFVARSTDKTPKERWEAKYRKSLVRSETYPYVASAIRNSIFNQDAAWRADRVVITEGVTDCIAINQIGISSVSPCTTQFKKSDHELLKAILNKRQEVFISNDNEHSCAGDNGAHATANFLAKEGYSIKLINIPLTEQHLEARRKLELLIG